MDDIITWQMSFCLRKDGNLLLANSTPIRKGPNLEDATHSLQFHILDTSTGRVASLDDGLLWLNRFYSRRGSDICHAATQRVLAMPDASAVLVLDANTPLWASTSQSPQGLRGDL